MPIVKMSATETKEKTVNEAEAMLGMPLPLLDLEPSISVSKDIVDSKNPTGKPRVVILGSGWGGFNFGN